MISIPNKDHFCAAAACRSAGVPSVWWVNDIVSAQFFSRLVRAVFLFRARRSAAQVVVVSDYARRALLDQGLPVAKDARSTTASRSRATPARLRGISIGS